VQASVVQHEVTSTGELLIGVHFGGSRDIGDSPPDRPARVGPQGEGDRPGHEVDRRDLPAARSQVPGLGSGAAAQIQGDAGSG
jgi:hypothetical protein